MILGDKVTNPGELRVPIELVPVTQSQDAGGFYHLAEGDPIAVWARWTNTFGSEAILAAAQGVEIQATVRIRYLVGLTNTWRVLKGGESYEIITNVDDIGERKEYMEFKVRRVKAA